MYSLKLLILSFRLLEFRVQIQSEEAVSTIDDISETKVLRDTEVDSLFVFKVTAE